MKPRDNCRVVGTSLSCVYIWDNGFHSFKSDLVTAWDNSFSCSLSYACPPGSDVALV